MLEKLAFFDQDTRTRLIGYSTEAESLASPDDVLNRLDDITAKKSIIRVLGAQRFYAKLGDPPPIELGKTAFLHKSVPQEWLEERIAFVADGRYQVGLMTARVCLAPLTLTELARMLEPVGIDRWGWELNLKYGLRDGFLCPIGGRWVVGYWSPKVLSSSFAHEARGLLLMAATAAAIRLERLVGEDVKRVGSRARLTARELSVLRHAAEGESLQEIAKAFHLGEETVRSHFKKAQAKLGTRNRTHTVVEAMRQLLIV